jgi:hypothetical protein
MHIIDRRTAGSSAWQSVGSVEDRRQSTGANALLWREMPGSLGRDHVTDVGRQLFNPAWSHKTVSEPPLGSPVSGAGRRGHDRNGAQFPAAGSAGISGIGSVSGWNVDQRSLLSVPKRAAGEYCA